MGQSNLNPRGVGLSDHARQHSQCMPTVHAWDNLKCGFPSGDWETPLGLPSASSCANSPLSTEHCDWRR
jgi:hypothetical protein